MNNTNKLTYLVLVMGYWGRGSTLLKAAQQCKSEGARAKDMAIARLVIGDDKAEVNGYGAICYNQGSEVISIGNGFKLSSLLNLKD